MKRNGKTIPNPGSEAAVRAGCLCAVLDNNHGMIPPWGTGEDAGWWITEGCPIHDNRGE